MHLSDLARTPLGIVVAAYAILVVGFSVAAFLLNVPLVLVFLGGLLAAAIGFVIVTRRDPPGDPPTRPGNQ